MTNVADATWTMLADAGVKRCYGIIGDALNPIIDALRRNGHQSPKLSTVTAKDLLQTKYFK